ncbi:MAG: DUF4339 domain-containing protein [Verrucomicrobiota bacterium]
MNEWYYARGGKQIGPISREALVELARNGGLDPLKDLVWTSSMKDWQPAGQVPGIFTTAVTTADPANPYAAPTSLPDEVVPAGSPVPEIVPGSQPLRPTACIKRAFDLVMRHFGMILLVGIVYIASSAIVGTLLTQVDSTLGLPPAQSAASPSGNPASEQSFHVAFGSEATSDASHLHVLLSNIFSIFLTLGLTRIGLNIVSGKPFTLAMLFGGGRQLLTACLATILYTAMILLGLILLIVPGIYLALRFGQYLPAIVDKNLGVLESLKYSSSLTTNNRLNLFGLVLLTIGLMILGLIALLVGLVVAIPIAWLAWMVAYRWLQHGYVAALDQPGTKTPMLASNP